MQTTTYSSLDPGDKELLDAAVAALKNAYAPYSHFMVGAALRSCDNRIMSGSNIENSVYPAGMCAERAAIARGNAEGSRCYDTIAIIGKGETFDGVEPVAPCGFCRQVISETSEISERDIRIIMSNTKKDKLVISTISELLPLAFGPKDLGIDVKEYKK